MNPDLLLKIDSYEKVKAVFEQKSYAFFTGHYNVNLFGVRANNHRSNEFDDFLCLAFEHYNRKILLTSPGTTDPGKYYLENPMNVRGTAILVPGQYRKVFRIDPNENKFRQYGKFRVYRDDDRDAIIDTNPTQIFDDGAGIHLHGKRGLHAKYVGKWSAGCQVVEFDEDLDLYYQIAMAGKKYHGDRITYTLLEENDFD